MISLLIRYKRNKAYERFYLKIRDGIYSANHFKWLCSSKKRYDNLTYDGQIEFLHTFFTTKEEAHRYEELTTEYFTKKVSEGLNICVENEALFPSLIDNTLTSPSKEYDQIVKIPFINTKALSLIFSKS